MQRNNPNRTQYTPNSEFGEAFKIIIQNQLSAQQDWLGLSNRTSFAPAPNPTLAAQIQKQLKEQQELLGLSNAATYTPEPNPALAPNPTLAENFETVIQNQLKAQQAWLELPNTTSFAPAPTLAEQIQNHQDIAIESRKNRSNKTFVFKKDGRVVPPGARIERDKSRRSYVSINGKLERVVKSTAFMKKPRLKYFNGNEVPASADTNQIGNKYYTSVNGKIEQVYTLAQFSNVCLKYSNGEPVPADVPIYKNRRLYYTSANYRPEDQVHTAAALRMSRLRLKAKTTASAAVEEPLAVNGTSIQNLPSLVENPLSFFNQPQNDAHNFNDMMNANNEDNNSEENFVTVSNSWRGAI